jgi:hypothetical protein
MVVACILGGILARRVLPEVDRSLKASGMVPNMQSTKNTWILSGTGQRISVPATFTLAH